jgi:hypothetical protein
MTNRILSAVASEQNQQLGQNWLVSDSSFTLTTSPIYVSFLNIYIAIGDGGYVLTSQNALNWNKIKSFTSTKLNGIAISNDRILVVGDSGVAFTSTNALDWTQLSSGVTSNLNAIAWNGGSIFVVVGDNAVIRTVTNSSSPTWTTRTISGATQNIYDVIWSTNVNLFIAVGSSFIATATSNGVSWTRRGNPVSATWNGITRSGSTHIIVGSGGRIISSTNGTSWSTRSSGTTNTLQKCTFANGQFVAVGTGIILTSPTGSTWTSRGNANILQHFGVAYLNNTYITVGTNGEIASSDDAITWTKIKVVYSFNACAYSENLNLFVAVGLNVTATSSDGIAWTYYSTPSHNAILYDQTLNMFIAVGDSGAIRTSTNGVDWTLRTSSTTRKLTHIIRFKTNIVICGEFSTILTSANGLSWTAQTSPATNIYYRHLVTDGNTLSALAEFGIIVSTTDGVNWNFTYRDAKINHGIHVSSIGKTFLVGDNGVVAYSSDGITWDYSTTNTTNNLQRVYWDSNTSTLVAVGNSGTIISSQNQGVSFTVRNSGTTNNLYAVIKSGSTWMVAGDNFSVRTSTNLITWTLKFSGTGRITILHSDIFGGPIGAYYTTASSVVHMFTDDLGTTWRNTFTVFNSSKYVNDYLELNGVEYICGDEFLYSTTTNVTWTNRTPTFKGNYQSMVALVGANQILLLENDSTLITFYTDGSTGVGFSIGMFATKSLVTTNDKYIISGNGISYRTSPTSFNAIQVTPETQSFIELGSPSISATYDGISRYLIAYPFTQIYNTLMTSTSSNLKPMSNSIRFTSGFIRRVIYANNYFYAISNLGNSMTVHSSSNGVNWTLLTTINSINTIWDVIYAKNKLFVFGKNNTVLLGI